MGENLSMAQACGLPWGYEEDRLMELIIAECWDDADKLQKVAARLPSKTYTQIQHRFHLLQEDIKAIEAGQILLPKYEPFMEVPRTSSKPAADQERRKGIPWTEEEHRMFLLGLAKFGKGDWRSISRNFVVSRTPTQVASHAQKYFIRLNSLNKKDKRRSSIHDITSAGIPGDLSGMAMGSMPIIMPGGGLQMASGIPIQHSGMMGINTVPQ